MRGLLIHRSWEGRQASLQSAADDQADEAEAINHVTVVRALALTSLIAGNLAPALFSCPQLAQISTARD